jgi:hypothetical protein
MAPPFPLAFSRDASPTARIADDWRQAVLPDSPFGQTLFFGGFRQAGTPDRRKPPRFCEAAESAKRAKAATSFLLAFSRDASAFSPVADDLRGAV